MRRFRAGLWRRPLSAVVLTLAALTLSFPAAAAGAETVVSLTFDDGTDDNYAARSILAAHGMRGTFYVNTSRIGGTGFLSWAQLEGLNADGNEIAGHTLNHVDLTTVDSTEARRQVCDDRQNLVDRGFIAQSFAYPYGEFDSTAKTIVRDCGYASGRGAFGLRNITSTTDTRPYAERIPPWDGYAIQTPCCIRSDTPLSALQNYVMNAEVGGGGWIPFVLHRICNGCGEPSISPATLDAFLDWLEPRAVQGTIVRTVHQVISGDATAPASSIACAGSGCSSGWYTGPVAVTLSATDAGGSGVSVIRYTTDGSEPTVSSPAYTGSLTVFGTATVKYRAWDGAGNVEATKAQLVRIDDKAPTSSIACNGSTCSTGAYSAPVDVTLSAADTGDSGVAAIRYTTDGSEPTAASPVYSGPFTVSETTTVNYRAWDEAGNVEVTRSQSIQVEAPPPVDGEAPTSTIACNASLCSSGWYTGPVAVTLSATDAGGSGVSVIRYTTDGSDPTAWSAAYTGHFTVSATTTVKYRAWDNAGNVEPTKTQVVKIDAEAPSVAITAPSAGATVKGVVKVTASTNDALSGVANVSFYANGVLIGTKTDPPYTVSWNTRKFGRGQYTLTAVANDVAGNSRTSSPVTVTVTN